MPAGWLATCVSVTVQRVMPTSRMAMEASTLRLAVLLYTTHSMATTTGVMASLLSW